MNGYKRTLKKYEDIALSNIDILGLLDGKANIVLYPDLLKYKNIDEVMGNYSACVLLFEANPNYGHWCCIFKINDELLEFFNPYGGYPDDSLEYIPHHFRVMSNQLYPYLSVLMINSKYMLSYNEYKFQRKSKNIRTCGRHVVTRLLLRNLSLDEYLQFLNSQCIKYNTDYDGVVTIFTMNINK